MEHRQFERLKDQVSAASAGQILELEDAIQRASSQQFIEMALARRTRQTIQVRLCPHCKGNNIVLHGKDQNRRQRFKCRGCGRTYNIMTGTPMARARKPGTWLRYLGFMSAHMSVREIVSSGIGVHQVTAWRWRHRFLQASVNDNASILSGVVEAGETFFVRSFKGSRGRKNGEATESRTTRPRASGATKRGTLHHLVPVLTALDNSGAIFQAILASPSGIEEALDGRIACGSVLCSSGDLAYANAADKSRAEHYVVSDTVATPLSGHVNPISIQRRLGLERVRTHHQRLKRLINERCRGVATKYLGNYLGWHRAMIRSGFEGKMLLGRALA